MATKRFYGYYVKGSKLYLAERDDTTGEWKSPADSITNGLRIEYSYSPKYFITSTNDIHTTITNYKSASSGGYLKIKGGSVNYDTTLDVDDYIVLRNAGRFNGLHKITAFEDADATNDSIVLNTKYSGSSSWSAFEDTVTMYYSVNVLNDEGDSIDLPSYLEKSVVDYLKARFAEDIGEFEMKEYFMREFRRKVEKAKQSSIDTPRRVSAGIHAIR